jgi:hypothetical protein
LIGSLERGLELMQDGSQQVDRLVVKNFPLPDGTTGPQDLLRIKTSNGLGFILPVVWSGLRMRATIWLNDPVQKVRTPPSFPPGELIAHLFWALPGLVLIPLHTLRCVPKARGFWKVALIITACILTSLWVGVFWVILKLYNAPIPVQTLTFNGLQFPFANLFWLFIYAMGGMVLLQSFLPAIDLAGDVAAYVGVQKRRDRVEKRMAEIIHFVRDAAPNADCLVVGHSLGSVLVTHSLLQPESRGISRGRLLMLTLGSPLRSLSRIFPNHVLSPEQLAARYAKDGTLFSWTNAWRTGDVVGKSIGLTADNFSENVLGSGGHTNYWKDVRALRLALSILK